MQQQKAMLRSFGVNIILVILKLISGFLFNSFALIADGIHSISDLLSDIFVLLGIRHSIKPADEDHPFGHGKFEYILSLFLGSSIIIIAYNLGKNVIQSFSKISSTPSYLSLITIVIVVVVKFILANYLIQKGKEIDSEIIRASGKESLSDVISSAVVFVGVIGVFVGEHFNLNFLLYGDKVASIIIALFIIKIGIEIMYSSIQSLQGRSVKKSIYIEYKKVIMAVKGVQSVDKLDMVSYGPYYQAIVEISVDASITVKEGHDIAHDVHETLLKNEKICHVSIHVNPKE